MEKKLFMILISVVLVCLLPACGHSAPTAVDNDTGNSDFEETISVEAELESENQEDEENETDADVSSESNDNFTGSVYDADFDVYSSYAPDSQITDAVLSDGAYIQIGNCVLEIGKSSISDFINAGVDLYDTKVELSEYYNHPFRDQEINEKGIQLYAEEYKSSGSAIARGFLSGDIRIDISSYGRSLVNEDTSDPIVDSVMIENYVGNIGNPSDYLYGGSEYKDINSIYITGGIKFTGPVSEISEGFGKVETDQQGESDGHQGWTRVFCADSENPNLTYYCQLLSAEDHCSSILLKLKEK